MVEWAGSLKAEQEANEVDQPVKGNRRFEIFLGLQERHRQTKQQAGGSQHEKAHNRILHEQIRQVVQAVRYNRKG